MNDKPFFFSREIDNLREATNPIIIDYEK